MKQIAQVTGRLRAIRLALGVIIALVWLPCALAQKFPSPISAVLIERGPLQQIDLTSTLSPGVSNLNLLAARFKLPGGRLTNDGVIFRLGGALAVTGMEAAQDGEFYPAHSPRVAVKAGAPRLHLLLGI